jgi:hypothetical protein
MNKTAMTQNTRHEIEPALVCAQIEKAIADHEARRIQLKEWAQETLNRYKAAEAEGKGHRWPRVPVGPGYVDPLVDSWIAAERNEYAKARVIELPQHGNRFVLVYGDVVDEKVVGGTGPFADLESAKKWFLGGGR